MVYKFLPEKNEISVKILGIPREESTWGMQESILANLFDAVQALSWVVQSAYTPKNSPSPSRPKPHPRPEWVSRRNIPEGSGKKKNAGLGWFPGKVIVDTGK